jgi:hypothetical protein
MNVDFPCPECGRRLRVGPELAGKRVRCPGCRKVVPAPAGTAPVTAATDLIIPLLDPDPPPDTGVVVAPPIPVEPIDDDQPAPAGPDACPGCGRFLDPGAVICLDCGFNRQTGKQLRTVSRRFDRRWYLGGVFSPAAVAIVVILYLFLGAVGLLFEDLLAALFGLALGVVPSVLLLGTFTRIRITRDRDGRALVLRDRWIAFIPAGHKEILLEGYTTIRLGLREGGANTLLLGFLIVFCLFGIPGILFYLLLYRGSTFTLEIGGDYSEGVPPVVEPEVLYRGPSEAKMRAIADALQEVAEMHYG